MNIFYIQWIAHQRLPVSITWIALPTRARGHLLAPAHRRSTSRDGRSGRCAHRSVEALPLSDGEAQEACDAASRLTLDATLDRILAESAEIA
jgi:hypothetical protein